MHANLSPAQAQVILDQLPYQPHVALHPDDNALFDSAKRTLERAALSAPRSHFKHLLSQGKSEADAKEHIRLRFGVTL